MTYTRQNNRVFFVIPTMAIGIDEDDWWFIEVAWLWFVVGFGSKE